MKRFALVIACLGLILPMACSDDKKAAENLPDGLYARITTDKGAITLKLEPDKAPLTVINFVGLAEGSLDAAKGKPYFDGLVFHRTIKNFMVQGGDPLGNGRGGPGYVFPNEISDLKFDKPGTLAMANAGPDTNGSQFFITHRACPELDGNYTIFGYVVSGQDVVNALNITDDGTGKPTGAKPEVMKKVEILRVGSAAKAFKADQKAFDAKLQEIVQSRVGPQIGKIDARWPGLVAGQQGLRYSILKQGNGAKPKAGQTASTLYKGMFADGKVFDSSEMHGNKPLSFRVAQHEMIPGYDLAVQDMSVGEKRVVVIPPELAYGNSGTPDGYIPPYSYLVFEITLTDAK